jgi:hypothetical protein
MGTIADLSKIFKVGQKPLDLSPSQADIFEEIVLLKHLRTQIIAPTQYGKSLDVGCATITRAVPNGEKFTILAPSEKKASIIMGYVIEHVFDDPIFYNTLELDKGEKLDRLRRERSRQKLTFKGGAGIQILTLDAKNGKRSIEAAMGFGGNRIILDESGLIDDTLYATVKRMLGGYRYDDTFLLEIGNPFYRNHFYRTWMGSRYHKIFINYVQAIKEGRFSPEFIEEMREEALFDIFYECKFPDEGAVDERGYRQLLTSDQIVAAFTDVIDTEPIPTHLGVDVGAGGDLSVFTMRNDDIAWLYGINKSKDTMTNVTMVEQILEAYPSIKDQKVFIDDIGVGHGVTDRLREKGHQVTAVVAGASPRKEKEKDRFMNVKAQSYWLTKNWIEAGGKIYKDDHYIQLAGIKYKINTDKKIQIEAKEDLKKRTGKSPDYAESLMLTFAPPAPSPGIAWI